MDAKIKIFLDSKTKFSFVYNVFKDELVEKEKNDDYKKKFIFVLSSTFQKPYTEVYDLLSKAYENLENRLRKDSNETVENIFCVIVYNIDKENKKKQLEEILPMFENMKIECDKIFQQNNKIVSLSLAIDRRTTIDEKPSEIMTCLKESGFRGKDNLKLIFIVDFKILGGLFGKGYFVPDKFSSTLNDLTKITEIFFVINTNEEKVFQDKQETVLLKQNQTIRISEPWAKKIKYIEYN